MVCDNLRQQRCIKPLNAAPTRYTSAQQIFQHEQLRPPGRHSVDGLNDRQVLAHTTTETLTSEKTHMIAVDSTKHTAVADDPDVGTDTSVERQGYESYRAYLNSLDRRDKRRLER